MTIAMILFRKKRELKKQTLFNHGYDLQMLKPGVIKRQRALVKNKEHHLWNAFFSGSNQFIKEKKEIQMELEAKMSPEEIRELDKGRLAVQEYELKYGKEIEFNDENYDPHEAVERLNRNKNLDNDNDLNI